MASKQINAADIVAGGVDLGDIIKERSIGVNEVDCAIAVLKISLVVSKTYEPAVSNCNICSSNNI